MRSVLTNDGFNAQLRDYAETAYRLEMQPRYWVAGERESFAKFLAGTPVPPPEVEGARSWLDQVAKQAAEGKRMERVRIHQDPPTDYQRWMRWTGEWNIRAGERIDYLTAPEAAAVGLLPAAGPRDWWLFDNQRLMIMTHNQDGLRIHTELVVDDDAVQQARTWWDLAIHTTRGAST